MAIEKSIGVTATEKILADLCDKTFLKLWSYPNPYKADGKELCDIIAVFNNHIFLFFDRESRKFDKSNQDIDVQWNRWYNNAIEKQLKTSTGAKRYVIENSNAIFLDSKASIPFPIPLPDANLIVHNIIIAHGAAEACKKFSTENVSGSLAICYCDKRDKEDDSPFFITLNRQEPIHVLDTSNFEIILKELDTVHDFSAYLTAKENAIKKYEMITYCGEEDLLANYFQNFNNDKQEYFIGVSDPSATGIMIGEGEWYSFIKKIEYKRRKDANRISEFWDELLQRTLENALNGTIGGNGNVFSGQSAVYEMAKEPRVSRRILSELMVHSMKNFPGDGSKFLTNLNVLPSFYEKVAYVFLQVHYPEPLSSTEYDNYYRPKRQALLEIACGVTKNKYPHYEKIIGIAIDAPKFNRRNSEDFLLLNCEEWLEDDREYYLEQNKKFRFLETKNLKKHLVTSQDFPNGNEYYKPSKVGRNNLCPCGSGKKYKRCCAK